MVLMDKMKIGRRGVNVPMKYEPLSIMQRGMSRFMGREASDTDLLSVKSGLYIVPKICS